AAHGGWIEGRRALHDGIAPADQHLLGVAGRHMILLVIDPRELAEAETHGGGLGRGAAEEASAEHAGASRRGHAEQGAAAGKAGRDDVLEGGGGGGGGGAGRGGRGVGGGR